MPIIVKNDILSNWQIIKARGKAVIISLVKYLKSMGIQPIVIHDEDLNKERAAIYNQPIVEAVGNPAYRIVLMNCIQDVLGYTAPIN